MAKSRIGPFALEAPLSAQKRSGQVFRGIHLEQKKLAALRVFAIPMGMTPESRQAYADQLEEIKQLRHISIVRCYGGGFDTRTAYLAYELVDGESLESLLERRGRLPWETVLEFSQQITKALQYAHHADWYHGRLKPDKVLVGNNGRIKLADWRREAITTTIGGTSRDVNTVQFSAPELLSGGEPNEKTDLYSVGAVMYAMLTGQPPFTTSNDKPHGANASAELRSMIETQPAPNVNATVLDCPVWLSAIVGQLLSKEPASRPFSTTALLLAFKEAERRQVEGVGVLQHAAAGFSPLKLNVDRDEAEKVLGIKPKKKKPQRETPFFEQAWVLLVALATTIATIVWFLLPLSANTLRSRAEKLLPPMSQEWMDWNTARDDYLEPLVRRFPDDSSTEWAQEQIAFVDARECERKLQREHRQSRDGGWTDAERQYWQATEYEQFGDLLTSLDKYRALVGLYGQDEDARAVVYLAAEAASRIRAKGLAGTQLQDFVARKLQEASEAYDQARILEARERWQWIVDLYSGNPELEPQVAEAQQRLEELNNRTR